MVTEYVVDPLETVEVEQQERKLFVATARARDLLAHAVVKVSTIGQTGQRIVMSKMVKVFFGLLALGDVE